MFCLEKLQTKLANFLNLDKDALPKIRDILGDNGYLGIKKGDETIYFQSIPLDEFGPNYAEFYRDGVGAIEKLLLEREGQVAGAFYKEGLGDIDLVWGDSKMGLAHILERREEDFIKQGFSKEEAETKAREFIKEIPQIIENGEAIIKKNEAVKIETDNYKLVLKQNWKGEPTTNKWLVTGYFKKEKEPSISTDSFTKEENLSKNSNSNYTAKKGETKNNTTNTKTNDLKQSKELEEAFLFKDKIDENTLKKQAKELPKALKLGEFKKQFNADNKGNAIIRTPIGEVKINVPKAYNHFTKNTYDIDRKEFSGAFLDTLVNPLFVVRQKYRPKVSLQGKSLQRSNNSLDSKIQNKSRIQIGNEDIIQDSYVFYKPFIGENGLVSLASFAISKNGELLHKTFYDIKTISKLKRLIKGNDEDLLYFKNEKPNIYHSNPHIGTGLASGTITGIEEDEQGNITFNPSKFVLGFLGGSLASKGMSEAYKKAKAKYYEKNFDKFIKEVNRNKPKEPRFEVTKELEKEYRNLELQASDAIRDKLKLDGRIKGDFIKLAQKHPEYFANPKEVKTLSEFILNKSSIAIPASDKRFTLLLAPLNDENKNYGAMALRIQNINGEHRIRSVILMNNDQMNLKIRKAKEQGEPIFHF